MRRDKKKRRSSRISNMVKEIPQNVEFVAKVAKRSSSLKKYIKDKNVPHCEKETASRGKDVEMQETNDKKVEDPVKYKNAPVRDKQGQYLKGCKLCYIFMNNICLIITNY